jgi:exodeoxyribonuclease VII small subunit
MNEKSDPQTSSDAGLNVEAFSFEAALEELQNVVRRLESGELSLEQSLQQFELGVKLTRACQERLAVAEQKVELLMKAGPDGKIETQTFTSSK